jgi:signal transduction histidine kinase/PAS domain-containing protein
VGPPAPPLSRQQESSRITSLEAVLAETRDYLQAIQEHQEASNEELQASNEESQSANEELQSLNEELETSKEELESTNEELTTVNEEMAGRNTELFRLNSDLTNLQTSANLIIVLLGRDLTIRRFSAEAEKQFNLLASDVGRPISRVRHNLNLPDLEAVILQVIARVREFEREVQSTGGRWYSVRIRPYLTIDNKVDGAVLVLTDIDALKQTEKLVSDAHAHAAAIIRTVHDPLVVLTTGLRIQSANEAFHRTFKLSPAETRDRSFFELEGGTWNIPRLRHLLENIVPHNRVFDDFEVTRSFKRIGRRSLRLNARLLKESGGRPKEILLGFRDVTEQNRAGEALRTSEQRFRALFDLGPVGVYFCDPTGAIQNFNQCAATLWGRKPRLGASGDRFCGSFKMFRPDGTLLPPKKCPMAGVLSGRIPEARDAEVLLERKDGSRITAIANIVPLKNERGEIMGAINCFYDITERKRAQEKLREADVLLSRHANKLEKTVTRRTAQLTVTNRRLEAAIESTRASEERTRALLVQSELMQKHLRRLTRQILTAQEEERKKISRELHDDVVQTLVGINVELSALVHGNSAGVRQLKGRITRTQRLVEKSVDSVHRFARELRPAVLDDLGLIPALHTFCKGLARRKKLKIHLTAFGGIEAMAGDKRTVLYRVAQEALTNVARHARATQVKLSIVKIPGAARMEVTDNGRSFPVRKFVVAKSKRLGLVGMKERVEMVGGTLTIESAPGRGTTIRAEIPFKPEPSKK